MAALFSSNQFIDFISDQVTAETAAKVANEEVANRGKTLYGTYTENGYFGFSTEKEPGDTHKIIVLGVRPLALFDEEDDSKLIQERTTDTDKMRAMEEHIRALEAARDLNAQRSNA